jgi:hypothetical protein
MFLDIGPGSPSIRFITQDAVYYHLTLLQTLTAGRSNHQSGYPGSASPVMQVFRTTAN